MHRKYFPPCPVDGPIGPPVAFSHLASYGAVPMKCSECQYLFEGECTRFMEDVGQYLHLDHGPCGVRGPTDPVSYEDAFIKSKVEVPRKCVECPHLRVDRIHGFHCHKDADKWGDFHRGLDWGIWAPDRIDIQLSPPKVTSKELALSAERNDMISFIKEYRRINPDFPVEEAKKDFAHFIEKLSKHR